MRVFAILFALLSSNAVHGFLHARPAMRRPCSLSMEAASLTKDGGVTKELLARGDGKAIEAGDILAVEYYCSIKGQASKPFAKGDKEQFIAKDGSMIRGWDLAVGSMKVGLYIVSVLYKWVY
jgi:hypothetical protein